VGVFKEVGIDLVGDAALGKVSRPLAAATTHEVLDVLVGKAVRI